MNELRTGKPSSVGISPERLSKVENLCTNWVAEGITPALSVLIARYGISFLHKSWGKLTSDSNSPPVTNDSMFGMASCSKPVTATAIMLLVEEGRIGLHRPLKEYLPEFEGPDSEKITTHHILSHTSGLPARSDAETIHAAENGLEFQPGSKMAYSNVGYDLLGMLVAKVSGQSFDVFTKERIFEPLGMKNTTFIHMGLARERCVQSRPGTTYDWPKEWEGEISGSSTLWSTAEDMGIFLQTYLNQGNYRDIHLLSRPSVAAMTRNQVQGIPREMINGILNQPQGLGWFLLEGIKFPNTPCLLSPTSYGHSGASGTMIWVDPTYHLIGAFLFTKVREEDRPLDHFVDSVMSCITDNKK